MLRRERSENLPDLYAVHVEKCVTVYMKEVVCGPEWEVEGKLERKRRGVWSGRQRQLLVQGISKGVVSSERRSCVLLHCIFALYFHFCSQKEKGLCCGVSVCVRAFVFCMHACVWLHVCVHASVCASTFWYTMHARRRVLCTSFSLDLESSVILA